MRHFGVESPALCIYLHFQRHLLTLLLFPIQSVAYDLFSVSHA